MDVKFVRRNLSLLLSSVKCPTKLKSSWRKVLQESEKVFDFNRIVIYTSPQKIHSLNLKGEISETG